MSNDIHALLWRSAGELADLVRAGQVSARELVEATLGRIAANAALNAFTCVDTDGALAVADTIAPGDTRPFAGVPIAIKDLNPVAGLPQSASSRLYSGYRPAYDAFAVRRLREAGFVIVGKTTSPELGMVAVTEAHTLGPTRNPWNLDHTPGGSSGGAGAAVAAGIMPVAHATDGGGSIRIPAACCGLVGLKPARGRISPGPDLGDSPLATQGVVTRTVLDSARLLDIMAGYEPGDATWAPPPPEPFAATATRPPRRLRIAVTTTPPFETPVDPLHIAAVHETATLLASLGHTVEEATPSNWQTHQLVENFNPIWAASIARGVRAGALLTGHEPTPDDLEPLTWECYQRGLRQSAVEYMAAIGRTQVIARTIVRFFNDYDIFLTPSLALRPLRIGELDTASPNTQAQWDKLFAFTPFTPLWNLTGQPAISLPLAHGDDGLPIGIQLIGPPADEGLLLALAAQLEAARPGAERRPEVRAED